MALIVFQRSGLLGSSRILPGNVAAFGVKRAGTAGIRKRILQIKHHVTSTTHLQVEFQPLDRAVVLVPVEAHRAVSHSLNQTCDVSVEHIHVERSVVTKLVRDTHFVSCRLRRFEVRVSDLGVVTGANHLIPEVIVADIQVLQVRTLEELAIADAHLCSITDWEGNSQTR